MVVSKILAYFLVELVNFLISNFAFVYLLFSYSIIVWFIKDWSLSPYQSLYLFMKRSKRIREYAEEKFEPSSRPLHDILKMESNDKEKFGFATVDSYLFNFVSCLHWRAFYFIVLLNSFFVIPFLFWLNAVSQGYIYCYIMFVLSIIAALLLFLFASIYARVVTTNHHILYRYALHYYFISFGSRMLLLVFVLLSSYSLVRSGDFLTLMISLEIQSLALYTLSVVSGSTLNISLSTTSPTMLYPSLINRSNFVTSYDQNSSSPLLETPTLRSSSLLTSSSEILRIPSQRSFNLFKNFLVPSGKFSGSVLKYSQDYYQTGSYVSMTTLPGDLIVSRNGFLEGNEFFDAVTRAEAGLKYFVLGSVASSFLLFSIALFYGTTGTIFFSDISYSVNSDYLIVIILIALLFKIGIAPFHWWLPDVYHGSSLLTTLTFSILPKLPLWYVLFQLFSLSFFLNFYSHYIVFFGVISVLVGSFGALNQYSFKRLMAYSAVSHSGFLLLIFACNESLSLPGFFSYIFFYVLSLIIVFTTVLNFSVRRTYFIFDNIRNFRLYERHNPTFLIIFVLSFFSIAGIPPLVGFYTKIYPIYLLVSQHSYFAALVVAFCSGVSLVYYLRLIRISLLRKDSKSFVFFNSLSPYFSFFVSFLFSFLLFGFFYIDDLNYLISFLLL